EQRTFSSPIAPRPTDGGDRPARSVRALRLSIGVSRKSSVPTEGGRMSSKTRPCEVCRRAIEPERIEAIPETRLCVEHARMIGKYGGEFLVAATRESLGKAGSLKKNYGDITTHKTRNRTAIERLRRDHLEGLRSQGGGSG